MINRHWTAYTKLMEDYVIHEQKGVWMHCMEDNFENSS